MCSDPGHPVRDARGRLAGSPPNCRLVVGRAAAFCRIALLGIKARPRRAQAPAGGAVAPSSALSRDTKVLGQLGLHLCPPFLHERAILRVGHSILAVELGNAGISGAAEQEPRYLLLIGRTWTLRLAIEVLINGLRLLLAV